MSWLGWKPWKVTYSSDYFDQVGGEGGSGMWQVVRWRVIPCGGGGVVGVVLVLVCAWVGQA